MSKGVTRDMQVRAQEQLDKQERLVERLKNKVDTMDRELREARIDLSNEEGILTYYRAHPALKSEVTIAQEKLWDTKELEQQEMGS